MSKHTPGPWILEWDPPQSFVASKCGREICGVVSAIDNDCDEEHANGRLIAAAPELLAACEAIERRILDAGDGLPAKPRNTQDVLRRIDSIPINVFLLAAVVEALKKARGA